MSTPNKYQPHHGARDEARFLRRSILGTRGTRKFTTWRPLVEPVANRRAYVETPCVKVIAKRDKRTGAFIGRNVRTMGTRLERSVPKVKGKANAKRAKRARISARLAA